MSRCIRIPARLCDPFSGDDDRTLLHRFAETQDDSAFAGLVNRHARMVLGVCRRTIRDSHLAEDAFQAVFLVLARNPRQAETATSVGGWLFGIARRIGLAARRHEERRQRLIAASAAQKKPDGENTFDDLLRVLDQELASLPETYRAPLVACFLEERTQDEAARQLNWSLSTLRRRLERAKVLLRIRLQRRGITLAAALLASAMTSSARASVPKSLLDGVASAGHSSPLASALASRVTRSVVAMKLGLAAMFVAATLGTLAVACQFRSISPSEKDQTENPIPQVSSAPTPIIAGSKNGWLTISGRVVFPREQEIPQAKPVPLRLIKDAAYFNANGMLLYRDFSIDPQTRGIANAVVWLRPDSDDRNAVFPPDKLHPERAQNHPSQLVIRAGRSGFEPRVLAARVGDRITFSNPTSIHFNVNYKHPNESDSGSFNIVLPPGSSHLYEPLLPQRLSPDFFLDNIHQWVSGSVHAFEHPYYAVTDAAGNFQIENAPAGTWRLVVWHEKTGFRGGAHGRFGEKIDIAPLRQGTRELPPIALRSE